MLLKLKDGGLLDIKEDKDDYAGCETCDYGSCYTNYFDLLLTKINIHIEASQMYEYALSDGELMQIILPNVDLIRGMTEEEFAEWLKEKYDKCNIDNIEFNITHK